MVQKYLIMVILIFTVGCASMPKPQAYLNEMKFSISPHIVIRDGEYFLQYQVDISNKEEIHLVQVVQHAIVSEKAYYYYGLAVSQNEQGELIERYLKDDGLEDFAKRNAVYWLNPDKTEEKLHIEGSGNQSKEH